MKKDKILRIFIFIQIITYSLTSANFEQTFEHLKSISERNGPFTNLEYSEMEEVSKGVLNLLENVTNIEANKTLTSTTTDILTTFSNTYNSKITNTYNLICRTCLWSFTKFNNLMKKKYGLTILNEFLSLLCSFKLQHSICREAINNFSPILIESLIERYLDAEFICTNTYMCQNIHFKDLNPDEYAKNLLKDKPISKLQTIEFNNSSSTLKVLHVTDIHTDLLYTEGSKSKCPDPICCRANNGISTNITETAGRWGSQGQCDLPLRTLDLFVETLVNAIKPDIIVFSGDNPPHNTWQANKVEIYEITKIFIDLLLDKYAYKGVIFPSLGNHESNIADQFNPADNMINEKDFLKKMGDIFRLKGEEHAQFKETGYFTTLYANSNLRIISLNCFFCDIMNFYLIKNPTDPGNQFEWLEKVLRNAERDGEFVFIVGHIPPGDNQYHSQCSKRYNAIVDRFSAIIRGQFYGHSHYDEFRVVSEYFNRTNIAGIIFTTPSLTTYTYKNPSFRVYEVDEKTKIVKDYFQYRLNITEANLSPDVKPTFNIAYSAREAFQVEHLGQYQSFRDNIFKLKNDPNWFNFVTDAFFAQGVEKLNYINNKQLPNYLSCRFNQDVFDEYFKCTGFRTWDETEYVNRFVELFSGNWYVKEYDHIDSKEEKKSKNLKFLSKFE